MANLEIVQRLERKHHHEDTRTLISEVIDSPPNNQRPVMTRSIWAVKDRTWKEQVLRIAVPNITVSNISCWSDTSWGQLPSTVQSYINSWDSQNDILDWYAAASEFRKGGKQ